MMFSDPIGDMLTRIRNANVVYREQVEVPGSRLKRSIAEILKREGFIRDYEWVNDGKQGVLRIFLKYGPNRRRVITNLKRVSRPGRRVYVPARRLPRVLDGLGVAIVSTPLGVMTDEEARRAGVGGEVLCCVW